MKKKLVKKNVVKTKFEGKQVLVEQKNIFGFPMRVLEFQWDVLIQKPLEFPYPLGFLGGQNSNGVWKIPRGSGILMVTSEFQGWTLLPLRKAVPTFPCLEERDSVDKPGRVGFFTLSFCSKEALKLQCFNNR